MRPGDEVCLRDSMGNLPYDITSAELRDSTMYPNANKSSAHIHVIQEAGEVIFVPRWVWSKVCLLFYTYTFCLIVDGTTK